MRLTALVLIALTGGVLYATPAAAGCDDDDRPGTPQSLSAGSLGSTGIMLSWSSNVGHYDIYIRDSAGRPVPEAPDIIGGATNRNFFEIFNLKPDKVYTFSMRARTRARTEGCVSKNASETVSARTDRADLSKSCNNYTQTAMENIQQMRERHCQLPNPYSGTWATDENTHFLYCLEQKRAGLQGDANAQWLRNQDLQACKERAGGCKTFNIGALADAEENKRLKCGGRGGRWSVDPSQHYDFCMRWGPHSSPVIFERFWRKGFLAECKAKIDSASQGGGGGGGASTPPPAEWNDMLKAHNEMRGQYCAAPLGWDTQLAKDAQAYAERCILNVHGAPQGTGENMADRENSDGSYPAGTNRQAFDDTWGCEKDEYHFDKPVIVGGFKEDCHKGKDGQDPVNGHFTQVVWRSTTAVGCGQAKCVVPDKDPAKKDHILTHWVCRYSPGGNDSSVLEANVKQPPCPQTFHKSIQPKSVSCFRGMILSAGFCACPPNRHWNGRTCTDDTNIGGTNGVGNPNGKRPPAARPPVQPTTPPGSNTGGTNTNRPVCPSNRPIGTPPNCCPTGTHFSHGICRWDRTVPGDKGGGGSTNGKNVGGTNSVQPGTPVCSGARPIGTPPNCCPSGTHFAHGICRHDRTVPGDKGGGGTIGTQPTKPCTGGRIGTPPNCTCPPGTHLTRSEQCEKNATPTPAPAPKPRCPAGRPFGTPPNNCCAAGDWNPSKGKCEAFTGPK